MHTILVYCSAVNAARLLHVYTMILLYPLEYVFRQLVSTLAHLSDLIDIPQYCLYWGGLSKILVEVCDHQRAVEKLCDFVVAQSIGMRDAFDFGLRALDSLPKKSYPGLGVSSPSKPKYM